MAAIDPSRCDPQQVDSYCQLYQQVIRAKGEGSIQATLAVKKRILANEQMYRQFCT